MRSLEHGAQAPIDSAHGLDVLNVVSAATRPGAIQTGSGLFRIGMKSNRDVAASDLVNVFQASQLDQLLQFQTGCSKSPLQARTVQQKVGSGVKAETIGLECGSK